MKKAIAVLVFLFLFLFTFLNEIHAQGTWGNLGKGIRGSGFGVLALCADTVNDVLYAGGVFDSAGSVYQNALAKWNGTKWDTTVSLASGTQVNALIMYKGNLIIGFNDGSVGEYNGSTLQYLPGFNESIYCFYVYNDTLYAGGLFTKSGSTILNCVAKWDGTKWLPVINGFSWINCCPFVDAMTEYKGNLVVAGLFDAASGTATTSIAIYDGNKWNSLGLNLSEYGSIPENAALEVYKNKLYIYGSFDSVNSVYTTCRILNWDGLNWDTLCCNAVSSTPLPPTNIKMKSFVGYLFVAGLLYNNQTPYKYDGNAISAVDSGVTGGNIYTFTAWGNSLYVGGGFQATIESKPYSQGISRWTPDTATAVTQTAKDNEKVSVYPNPASNQLRFSSSNPVKQIQVENVLGQTLIEQNYFTLQPPKGGDALRINVSTLPAGIYFYRVFDINSQVVTGKFIKE